MGREVLEKYRKFVNELPKTERDMPYLKAPDACEEGFLSPNEVLEHLEDQDECGKRLQEMKEQLRRR